MVLNVHFYIFLELKNIFFK